MKLRIISGEHGGRFIEAPKGYKTHPMSEKIRGAIFNALGDINGLRILDAYAGSGAIAIEAISRGATFVNAIDNDSNAFKVVTSNVSLLSIGPDRIKVTRANISSWLDKNPELLFDIVVADPPFKDVKESALIKLAEFVIDDGLIVYSLPPQYAIDLPSRLFSLLSDRNYGDARVIMYKKIAINTGT